MNGTDADTGKDVIVGVDGTPASDAALRWAAAEAARSRARLRVVLVYHWRWPGGIGATDRIEGYTREQAEAAVDAAVRAVRAHRPGLDVSGFAVFGDPADVLAGLAAGAALTVVGSHGRTALADATRGATGTRVAMRARGRVAVVRGRTEAADGPVVVGVDGSPTDDRLLATAFEHAARRGCEVVALRVQAPQAAPWGVGIPPLATNPVQARANRLAELTDDVQRWHEKYPTVPAMARMPGGDPASALLDASGEAQLLVLGGRAHGPVAGLLAGSVSQRLLFHAECPLLIVHDGRRG
ncbi:universal stress protein [Dactylosporangium sp. NPDC048998]|uniref:universal stress protein n=1 Tax=Dactylosporangium sp. NPDC048998 TaxID=3363976 RepID=UPI00371D0D55